MARSTDSPDRIADVPWGRMTQFVTRLHNAGLTGDDIKKLLANAELLTKMVGAIKALLAEPIWDVEAGLPYDPVRIWRMIAPGVQTKLPEGHDRMNDHILVRVKNEGDTHFGEPVQVHPSRSWTEVAPGVQVRKGRSSGLSIVVRKIKTL